MEAVARKGARLRSAGCGSTPSTRGSAFRPSTWARSSRRRPLLVELHNRFLPEQGWSSPQKHHEIYLSDYRKVAPEKLRTIIRQPVTRD